MPKGLLFHVPIGSEDHCTTQMIEKQVYFQQINVDNRVKFPWQFSKNRYIFSEAMLIIELKAS